MLVDVSLPLQVMEHGPVASFQCLYCGACFSTPQERANHMYGFVYSHFPASIYNASAMRRCTICSCEVFIPGMSAHNRAYHPPVVAPAVSESVPPPDERPEAPEEPLRTEGALPTESEAPVLPEQRLMAFPCSVVLGQTGVSELNSRYHAHIDGYMTDLCGLCCEAIVDGDDVLSCLLCPVTVHLEHLMGSQVIREYASASSEERVWLCGLCAERVAREEDVNPKDDCELCKRPVERSAILSYLK